MSKETVIVPLRDFQMLLLGHFRYALGRQTYISGVCSDWIIEYWDKLPQDYQRQIHEDIEHAIKHNSAGAACDVEAWRKVLPLKRKETP